MEGQEQTVLTTASWQQLHPQSTNGLLWTPAMEPGTVNAIVVIIAIFRIMKWNEDFKFTFSNFFLLLFKNRSVCRHCCIKFQNIAQTLLYKLIFSLWGYKGLWVPNLSRIQVPPKCQHLLYFTSSFSTGHMFCIFFSLGNWTLAFPFSVAIHT